MNGTALTRCHLRLFERRI